MISYFILVFLLSFKLAFSKVEIFQEEFQEPTIDLSKVTGWSHKLKERCALKTTHEYTGDIFGPFLKNIEMNTKVYSNLPPHWSISFKADVILYGSVDSEVSRDQVELVLDNQKDKASQFSKKYQEGYQICQNLVKKIDLNIFSDSPFNDKIYPFYQNITHSASTFEIKINSKFMSKFTQVLADTEGYALKYIQVAIDTCFQTCAKCTGPSIYQCSACPKDAVLKSGKCLCSSGKIAHNYKCVDECPQGYTSDQSKTYCISASCDQNCQNCETTTKICTQCKTGFNLFEGKCITQCPSTYTAAVKNTCLDKNIDGKTETRVYVFKGLYESDFTESDIYKYEFTISGFPLSGGKVRKCGQDPILGGFMIASKNINIKKGVSQLEPHYKLKFGMTIYMIDSWSDTNGILSSNNQGSFTITYGNNQKENFIKKNLSGTKQNICGLTSQEDFIYYFSKEINHQDSTFTFSLTTDIDKEIYNQSIGIREVFILIEKCPDTCAACNSPTDCTLCKPGFQKEYGACKKCPDGKFAKNGSCTLCNSECKTCIGETNKHCTSCNGQKPYLHLSQCLDKCPDGFAPSSDNTCQPCHEICNTCIQPNNDSTCSSCTNDLYLEGTQCISQCKEGYYGSLNKCLKCSDQCKSCSNNEKECTQCPQGKLLQDKSCLDKCLDGFYNEGGICTKCNEECSKCDGPLSTNCQGCSGNTSLFESKCVSVCPDQNVSLQNECKKCFEGCNKCSGTEQNKCQECINGYFFLDTNQCLKNCPENYFNNTQTKKCTPCFSSCSICVDENPTSCQKCRTGFFFIDGQCKSSCPVGQYGNISTQKCEKCHDSCKGCKGPSQNECDSCNTGAFLTPSFICSSICPETYFSNILTNMCDKCQKPCEKCNDSATKCTSCLTGFLLKKDCIDKCPLGYFGNTTTRSCEQCSGNCKTCENKSSFCLTCKDKTYLINNQCLETCPKGQYPEDASNTCKDCDSSCTSCVGPKDTDCSSCKDGKYYDITNPSQPCQVECPSQYFGNFVNMQCEKCDNSCKKCTGKLNNQCTECADEKLFHDGQCLDSCPDSYFQQGKLCQKCHEDCFQCKNGDQNQCTACIDDRYLEGNSCIKECPITKFKNHDNNQCEICNQCYSCTGPLTTECLSCEGEYLLNPDRSCQLTCPSHFFKNLQNHKCEECNDTCLECSGNASQCDKCGESKFLDKNNRICVEECPKQYFEDKDKRECQKCNESCYECDTSIDKCISCIGQKFLTAQNTCSTSCGEGYYPISSQNICQKCDQNCKNCEDVSTKCTECENNKFLYKNQCVEACPNGYYANLSRQCLKCSDNCLTCQNRETQCLSCDINKQLYLNPFDQTCTQNCPLKTFQDVQNAECKLCHSTCLSCTNNQEDSCLSCESTFLYLGKCKQDCPDHFFKNKQQKICEKCNDKCSSCFDFMEDNCLSCYEGSFLNKNNKTCGDAVDCPIKTFANKNEKTCDDCHSSCASCSGSNDDQCIDCANSQQFYNNKCYSTCPANTFKDGNNCSDCHLSCSQCTDSQQNSCLACRNLGEVIENGQCVTQCSDNYFIEDSSIPQKVCKICSDKCNTCSGPSENECTSCHNLTFLLNSKCVGSCPSNFIIDDVNHKCLKCPGSEVRYQNKCIQTCPPKTYEQDQECFECSANCESCNNKECLICSQGYLNQDGICKTQCDETYFKENTTCLKCSSDCHSCNGPSNIQCESCQTDKTFYKGECLKECPESFYKDQKECKSCDTSCLACSVSATNCTKCKKDEGLYETKCYSQPPPNTFKQGDVYINCHVSCQSCKGSLETECQSCKPNDFSIDTRCVSKCPSGYFENKQESKCLKCLENCSMCSQADQCNQCTQGFFLDGNKCISKCAEITQYQDELTQTCVNCHASCQNKGCRGETEKDCIDDDLETLSISESTMFKVFIGQTVSFFFISAYGYMKDKNDEKNSNVSQISSDSSENKSSQQNSPKSSGEKVVPIIPTQLKTNQDNSGRINRRQRKQVNKLSQFTSIQELDDKIQQTQADGGITPHNQQESSVMNIKSFAQSSAQVLTMQNLNDEQTPAKRTRLQIINKISSKFDNKSSQEVLPTFSNQDIDQVPQESTNNEDNENKYSKINKKGLYYTLIAHEIVQIFAVYRNDLSRFKRSVIVFFKYIILMQLIYHSKESIFIASLAFLLVSQLIKIIIQKGMCSISILQRFQGAIPIILIVCLSFTNTFVAFIPKINDINEDHDKKWAFSYLLTLAIDITIIQSLLSFTTFKVSLMQIQNKSYKFKQLIEKFFTQNFIIKSMRHKL